MLSKCYHFKNVISTKIVYFCSFFIKVFETQCKYSTFQLRLVTSQACDSHMQPSPAYWAVTVTVTHGLGPPIASSRPDSGRHSLQKRSCVLCGLLYQEAQGVDLTSLPMLSLVMARDSVVRVFVLQSHHFFLL